MRTTVAIFEDITNSVLVRFALLFGGVKTIFLTYIFDDFQFAGFLFTLVLIDCALGLFFAIRSKDYDPRAFGRFLEKVFLYFAVLSMGHVISHYTIDGQEVRTLVFMKNSVYSFMIVREATSIMKHSGKRYPGFARAILKYFRGYNEEGLPETKQNKK
jgi:phage-related holin